MEEYKVWAYISLGVLIIAGIINSLGAMTVFPITLGIASYKYYKFKNNKRIKKI